MLPFPGVQDIVNFMSKELLLATLCCIESYLRSGSRWRISIFESITPAPLPPYLECLMHYNHTLHAFYVLSFIEIALWKSQLESES